MVAEVFPDGQIKQIGDRAVGDGRADADDPTLIRDDGVEFKATIRIGVMGGVP